MKRKVNTEVLVLSSSRFTLFGPFYKNSEDEELFGKQVVMIQESNQRLSRNLVATQSGAKIHPFLFSLA